MIEVLISSTILILMICLIRMVFRNRVSPRILYGMWGLVVLRLTAPWFYPLRKLLDAWESRVSVMNAAERVRTQVIAGTVLEPLADNVTNGRVYHWDAGDEAVHLVQKAAGIDWQLWIMIIWMIGCIILFVWMAAVNIRFENWLTWNARRYQKPLPEFVTRPVYVVRGLDSPCYAGFGKREAIYLPESIVEDEQKVRHALAHEMGHAMQRDRYWGILRCGLLCYYWVNPFVWLAAVVSKRDCELACDELAVNLLGEEERIDYGKTLVALAAGHGRNYSVISTATTMSAGKNTIRERIQLLVKHPKTTAGMAVIVACAMVGMVACTFSGGTEEKETHDLKFVYKAEERAEPAAQVNGGEIAETTVQTDDENGDEHESQNLTSLGDRDELVLTKEENLGCHYRLTLQRRDKETGEALPVYLSDEEGDEPWIQVVACADENGTLQSGNGALAMGYGTSLGEPGQFDIQVDFWNVEETPAFLIEMIHNNQKISYMYRAHPEEPLESYQTHELIQGVEGTSAVLTGVTLYPNAVWIRMKDIEREGRWIFLEDNSLRLQLAGQTYSDESSIRGVYSQNGEDINLFFTFDKDIFPSQQMRAIIAESKDGKKKVATEFSRYRLHQTARAFTDAYMSGDIETASKYCIMPKNGYLKDVIPLNQNEDTQLTVTPDEKKPTERAFASYRFMGENETDSYTYLSMVLELVDGEWKVTETGFEK